MYIYLYVCVYMYIHIGLTPICIYIYACIWVRVRVNVPAARGAASRLGIPSLLPSRHRASKRSSAVRDVPSSC